jgi:hypothetical protein
VKHEVNQSWSFSYYIPPKCHYASASLQLNNYMELSPSWETASCPATQEIHNILWNPSSQRPSTAPYHNPDQSSKYNPILRSILILSTNLRHGLPIGLLHLDFPPISYKSMQLRSPFVLHACPSHPPRLHHSNYTWRRVEIMKLNIMDLLPTACHFTPFWSIYYNQHPTLKYIQSMNFIVSTLLCVIYKICDKYNNKEVNTTIL